MPMKPAPVSCSCPENFLHELQWKSQACELQMHNEIEVQSLREELEEQDESFQRETDVLLNVITDSSGEIRKVQAQLTQCQQEKMDETRAKIEAQRRANNLQKKIDIYQADKLKMEALHYATNQKLEAIKNQLRYLCSRRDSERESESKIRESLTKRIVNLHSEIDVSVEAEQTWRRKFHKLQRHHALESDVLHRRVQSIQAMVMNQTRKPIPQQTKPIITKKQLIGADGVNELSQLKIRVAQLEEQLTKCQIKTHIQPVKRIKVRFSPPEEKHHPIVRSNSPILQKPLVLNKTDLMRLARFEYDTERLEREVVQV